MKKHTAGTQSDNISRILSAIDHKFSKLSNGLKDVSDNHEKAFYAKEPKTVNVSDKPLSLSGEVKHLSIDQFSHREQIIWTSTPYLYQERKQKLLALPGGGRLPNHALFEFLYFNSIDQHLVICDINERVGKGVFTTKAFKQCDVIALYSGLLYSANSGSEFKEYGYICNHSAQKQALFSQHYGTAFYDAVQYRNYSSYIQHAPNEHDSLGELGLPAQIERLVATGNIAMAPSLHLGYPVLVLIAMRDIAVGEQLLLDYGKYWQNKIVYNQGDGRHMLFDLQGAVIGSVGPTSAFKLSPGYDLTAAPKAIRHPYDIEEQLAKRAGSRDDQKNYAQHFLMNMRSCIANAIQILPSQYHAQLQKMLEITQGRDNAMVHNRIFQIINSPEFKNDPQLKSCWHELVLYMNIHNQAAQDLNKVKPVEKPKNKPSLSSSFRFKFSENDNNSVPELKQALNKVTALSWRVLSKKDERCQQIFAVGDQDATDQVKQSLEKLGISPVRYAKVKGKLDICISYDVGQLSVCAIKKISVDGALLKM